MMYEIKNRFNSAVLFSLDCESLKDCVVAAIKQGAYLQGAYLYGANLQGAYLRGAYLQGADLRGAYLQEAYLQGAYLQGAYLQGADLYEANLYGADLRGAYLQGAYLRGAYLQGADLYEANLYGADLRGAYLQGAKNERLILAQLSIVPQEGAFVGWKKLKDDVIARLVIPHDAKRLNSIGSRKCRASYVVVHEIFDTVKTHYDKHTGHTKYIEGEEVYPDKFDDDIRVECSHGIHFFLTREEAEAY